MSHPDFTDLRLLRALAREPGRTVVALASALGISRNTVQARLGRLQHRDAFLPFERRINPATLGYPLLAFVHVHVRQQQLEDITSALALIPEVVEAHGLTGDADLLLRVVAADTEELFAVNRRLLAIPGVERCDTNLAMGELIAFRMQPLIDRGLQEERAPTRDAPPAVRGAADMGKAGPASAAGPAF